MSSEITTVGNLTYPVFYPSVSSVSKNVWNVLDHVELLVSYNYPQFLISSFDVNKYRSNSALSDALRKAKEQGQVLLYDSGIYEVVWGRSKRWCKKRYIKTLQKNHFTNAFDFDDYILNSNTSISSKKLVDSVKHISSQVGRPEISPIIHCKNLSEYADVCVSTSLGCRPRLLAIPERELGAGMVEIAKTINGIRRALDRLDYYQPVHILGTGNPLSMMVYAFCGADSFDGLDWCQTVVDYEAATLHHPLHFDLYASQGQWGNVNELSFFSKCYLHNLDFYTQWMKGLGGMSVLSDKLEMIEKYIPNGMANKFKEIIVA